MPRGAALAYVALAATFPGCGGGNGSDDVAPEPPRAPVVRDCRTHVEGRLAADARRRAVVAGPLWLPYARGFANDRNPDPGARFVDYKTLVVVKAGEEVSIAIPARAHRRAALDYEYGNRRERRTPPVTLSDGVGAVRFVACEARTRPWSRGHPLDRETQFNGGIITRWGRCLPLEVWGNGADEPRRVTISFGAGRCSG